MSSAKFRVFISSTQQDLVEYRDAVRETLRSYGFDPIDMVDFPADHEAPVKVSVDRTKDADVFVGIYAWKYGSYPAGSDRSFIEHELDAALAKGIPCFFFVVDESSEWSGFKDSGKKAEQLAALKERVFKLRVVKVFRTPDQLAKEVGRALVDWERERNLEDQERERQRERERQEEQKKQRDPLRPGLVELLEKVERRATDSLAQRTASRSLDLVIEWRDCLRGPLAPKEGSQGPRALPLDELRDLFRDRQRLLILGGTGSGKTVTLLRLTRDLIQDIERSTPLRGIPAPLSLASWKATDTDLEEWLVRELIDQLTISPADVRQYVQEDRLVPMLDGLDEVDPNDRHRCVKAIELYLQKHGPLVVSCLTQAHQDLAEPFQLNAEVSLQPMDEKSAEGYLAQASPELSATIRKHDSLRELSRTPLWLTMMCDVYEKARAEDLKELAASPSEELPRRVVKAWVGRMEDRMKELMEERPGSIRYGIGPTRRYLTWFARQMREHRIKRFEIELLQPIWLPSLAERWLYAGLTRATVGGLLAAALALLYPFLLPAGLVAGALAGLVDALPVWRAPTSNRATALALQRTIRVLVIAVVSFMTFLQFSTFNDNPLLFLSLLLGVVFGLVFGTRPGDLGEHTRVFEKLTWKWSWKGGLTGSLAGAVWTASLAALVYILPQGVGPGRQLTWFFWVVGGMSAAVGFFLGGVLGGLTGSTAQVRTTPNVGFRRGLRKLGTAVGVTALWVVPAGTLVGFLWEMEWNWNNLGVGAFSGLVITLYVGLWFSGMDLIQHWTTRTLLSSTRRFPWRWVRFLNHAAERGLLDRNGRGYEFPHDVVRDYFRTLPEPDEEAE